MLVVLDTTVLIDFLRGRPVVNRVHGLRNQGDVPATSAINVEEIARGMRDNEMASVTTLLEGLVVLSVDQSVARRAGLWRRDYASRGITLSQPDCLVAATAHIHNAKLCTGNPKDFPMLDVEHWPISE